MLLQLFIFHIFMLSNEIFQTHHFHEFWWIFTETSSQSPILPSPKIPKFRQYYISISSPMNLKLQNFQNLTDFTNEINCNFTKFNEKFQINLTVGTYSDGNLLVVYEIKRQVLPTAPSPTTTHLIVCIFTKFL